MNKNNKHILVVDDDDRIRDLIKEYLIKNYYIVTTAKDAFDAQKKVMIIKFDLIVLDIMMPGKTGLELTMEMKKISSTPLLTCPPRPTRPTSCITQSYTVRTRGVVEKGVGRSSSEDLEALRRG